jgi:hypothetical protein
VNGNNEKGEHRSAQFCPRLNGHVTPPSAGMSHVEAAGAVEFDARATEVNGIKAFDFSDIKDNLLPMTYHTTDRDNSIITFFNKKSIREWRIQT